MIRISVVVPFHNSERYIAKCIEDLLSQQYPLEHYEVVMIDNNSADGSAEIVKRYPRVKLVAESKQGAYAARNRGVREARGGIIAFTDADCVPTADWLKEIDSAMADPRVGVVIGSHQLGRDSFFLSLLEDYEHGKNTYIFNSEIKELYYGYTRNMVVRRSLFDEVGPFVERARGADVIFVHRCLDKYSCALVRYLPQVRVRHLEIERPSQYFRKVFVYGTSSRRYRQVVHARPLTIRERLLIFRRTVQGRRYPWVKSLFLLGLLAIGQVYWILGGISAAWDFRPKLKR